MRQRIIALRKALKLKQIDFARKMGMRQTTLSNIETGKNGVSEAVTRLICLTFNVSETWLRTGAGPMFGSGLPSSPDEEELVTLFRKHSPAVQRVILNMLRELLEAQEQGKE
jgi:transcriptional regulator with XRE-family HTH domain